MSPSPVRRDERMAAVFVRPMVAYLRGLPGLGPDSAVLDFGCGYLDNGLGLADRVGRVDGTDIDPYAVRVARARVRERGLGGHVTTSPDELPAGGYDLVFTNSVFQYLGGDAGIADALARFRGWLKPGGRAVVADLIPLRYSAALDAGRSVWVAVRNGVLPAMLAHLWRAARAPADYLHRIDPGRFAGLAADAGFACELLPRNLTPSRRRYSCLLTAR